MTGDKIEQKTQPLVTSVSHAISILKYLSRNPEGAGVTSIAANLSISPSSCFNILKTLVALEWLEFDKHTKYYRLGLGAIDLARGAIGFNNIMPSIEGQMKMLAHEHHVSVGLWRMYDRRRLVLVGGVESDAQTRIHLTMGQRVPIIAGAIGYCVAASLNLTRSEIADWLDKTRWQAKPSLDEFLVQVDQAHEKGWAIDVGKWLHGLTNIGAPIVNEKGEVTFGLTATMFAGQHDQQTLQTICEEIGELGAYASNRLFGTSRQRKAG